MFELWLISVADSLKGFFYISATILMIASIIFSVLRVLFLLDIFEVDSGKIKKTKLWIKTTVITCITCFFLYTIIPTSKDAYIILGGGMVLDFFQDNPEAQKLPENLLKNVNDWLESYQDNDSIK